MKLGIQPVEQRAPQKIRLKQVQSHIKVEKNWQIATAVDCKSDRVVWNSSALRELEMSYEGLGKWHKGKGTYLALAMMLV